MKKIISILLTAILILTASVGAFAESDKEKAALELEKYGIVRRNHLGALTVDGPVTRADMAKMLVILLGLTPGGEESEFADVPKEHWAKGYIARAAAFGIVNGMGDGTFLPDENITYQQAMKMIVCALGYNVDAERKGGYPYGYTKTAMMLGIMSGKTSVTEVADRGEIILMLVRALDVPVMVTVENERETIYKILNGKDGERLVTLRTRLE